MPKNGNIFNVIIFCIKTNNLQRFEQSDFNEEKLFVWCFIFNTMSVFRKCTRRAVIKEANVVPLVAKRVQLRFGFQETFVQVLERK